MKNLIFPIHQNTSYEPTKSWVVIYTRQLYSKEEVKTYQWEFDDYKTAINEYKTLVVEGAEHLSLVDTNLIVGLWVKTSNNMICERQILLSSYDK